MFSISSKSTGIKNQQRAPHQLIHRDKYMIIIKAGGGRGINWEGICQDLVEILEKDRVILVHGANARRDEIASKLAVPIKTVTSPSGISSVYTDKAAMEVFLMTYAGLVNKSIVAMLHNHGINAVGLSGVDGKLWEAKPKKEILIKEGNRVKVLKGNLTGRVERINTDLIRLLVDNGYLPVICPPAISHENEILNTDNDWAVAVMAEALEIKRIISLFEAPGLLGDPDDEKSLVTHIEKARIDDYLAFARKRMKKKVLGAKRALDAGVETIYWGDGRRKNPIKALLAGEGTVIS